MPANYYTRHAWCCTFGEFEIRITLAMESWEAQLKDDAEDVDQRNGFRIFQKRTRTYLIRRQIIKPCKFQGTTQGQQYEPIEFKLTRRGRLMCRLWAMDGFNRPYLPVRSDAEL